MNTDRDAANLQKKQAIKDIYQDLYRLYREAIGKEPDTELLWAEAEDFVAKHGPNVGLKDLF